MATVLLGLMGVSVASVVHAVPAGAQSCPVQVINGIEGDVGSGELVLAGTSTPAGPSSGDDWSDCNLSLANFRGDNFSGVDLDDATLSGAAFDGVFFQGSNLVGANFTGASVTDAYFTNTDLAGDVFTGTSFDDIGSGGVTGTPATALPADWALAGGYLFGPTANLGSANLGGLDLSTYDLADAAFWNVSSGGTTGTPTLPSDVELVPGGYLIAPEADLELARPGGR